MASRKVGARRVAGKLQDGGVHARAHNFHSCPRLAAKRDIGVTVGLEGARAQTNRCGRIYRQRHYRVAEPAGKSALGVGTWLVGKCVLECVCGNAGNGERTVVILGIRASCTGDNDAVGIGKPMVNCCNCGGRCAKGDADYWHRQTVHDGVELRLRAAIKGIILRAGSRDAIRPCGDPNIHPQRVQ